MIHANISKQLLALSGRASKQQQRTEAKAAGDMVSKTLFTMESPKGSGLLSWRDFRKMVNFVAASNVYLSPSLSIPILRLLLCVSADRSSITLHAWVLRASRVLYGRKQLSFSGTKVKAAREKTAIKHN